MINGVEDFYQSFRVYFFENSMTQSAIQQRLKRENTFSITRITDKNLDPEIVLRALINNIAAIDGGLVFDLTYYKNKSDEDQKNDETHKVVLSIDNNLLFIFGSFTNEKIPRAIKNIIYGRKVEFIFKPLQYDRDQIVEVIDNLTSTGTIVVDDPRFSFFMGLFNEKRYSNFAGANYTCATKTAEYTEGINKCSDCRPIFLITEFDDLDLTSDSVGSKLLVNNNPMSFWIPGKYIKYDKWIKFFYDYCYNIANKHKNTS